MPDGSPPARPTPCRPAGGFGIYVHWPFCASKCPYCDFNSHVRATVDQTAWREALRSEIDYFAATYFSHSEKPEVGSIFFGGGTPSRMAPATAAALISRIGAWFPFATDIEISLEANPTSTEAAALKDFRAAGVNRLSLGMQALNDTALRFLGRPHNVAEALRAFETARQTFPRVSFDLIYAYPGQTAESWRDELAQALAFAPDHLSLYQLTIEENTGFHTALRRGELKPLPDDAQADLFELTQELTEQAGLPAYEISNHARPGQECRHNLVYWRSGLYLGIGPGAHGRIAAAEGRLASQQVRNPEAWAAAVAEKGHGTLSVTALTPDEAAQEYLMMGLRLTEGVGLPRLRELARNRPVLNPQALDRLRAGGLVAVEGDRLSVTPAGRPVLNRILAELIA